MQGGWELKGCTFVELKDIDVVFGDPESLEQRRYSVGWSNTYLKSSASSKMRQMEGHTHDPGRNSDDRTPDPSRNRFQSHRLRHVPPRQSHRTSSITDLTRITRGSSAGSVGLERRFELGEGCKSRLRSDSFVSGDELLDSDSWRRSLFGSDGTDGDGDNFGGQVPRVLSLLRFLVRSAGEPIPEVVSGMHPTSEDGLTRLVARERIQTRSRRVR